MENELVMSFPKFAIQIESGYGSCSIGFVMVFGGHGVVPSMKPIRS